MKFDRYDIVMQEIPGEITLMFTVTNCPHLCNGCHSEHLRSNTGTKLTRELLSEIYSKYKNKITNILFLGGDSHKDDILDRSEFIKKNSEGKVKVSMYSGCDMVDSDLASTLDYYKVGSWQEEFGPLDDPSTNQKLFKRIDGNLVDVTHKFWKSKIS